MTKKYEAEWDTIDRKATERRLGPEAVQAAREHAAESFRLSRKLLRLHVPSGLVLVIHGPLIPVLKSDLSPMPASASPGCYQNRLVRTSRRRVPARGRQQRPDAHRRSPAHPGVGHGRCGRRRARHQDRFRDGRDTAARGAEVVNREQLDKLHQVAICSLNETQRAVDNATRAQRRELQQGRQPCDRSS